MTDALSPGNGSGVSVAAACLDGHVATLCRASSGSATASGATSQATVFPPDAGRSPTITIAALFVSANGCYAGLPGVDVWDVLRDARAYAGPHPVVAHPPCQRWGNYWSAGGRYPEVGMDSGCFASALASVRRWGGVLEHPAGSQAWERFGLKEPPRSGGWIAADFHGGWTCCVEQGHYGHRARKATWLYACGIGLPPALTWGKSVAAIGPRPGRDPARERRIGAVQRMGKREREATPIPFRDLLVEIVRSAEHRVAA